MGLVVKSFGIAVGVEDPVQGLHLLEDAVLDAVLHLVDGTGRPFHPLAEDGVRLVLRVALPASPLRRPIFFRTIQ